MKENIVFPNLLTCGNHLPFCLYQNVTSWWLWKYLASYTRTRTRSCSSVWNARESPVTQPCPLPFIDCRYRHCSWSIYLAGATGNAVILRWIILFIKISFLYLKVFNRYFYDPKKEERILSRRKKGFSGSLSTSRETEFKKVSPGVENTVTSSNMSKHLVNNHFIKIWHM